MKAIFCLFVVIATLVISGQSQRSGVGRCTNNDAYTDCGPACEKGCPGIGPACEAFSQQCVRGCFCKSDEVRLPNGSCGPYLSCPQIQPTRPQKLLRPERIGRLQNFGRGQFG